jgi:endonuclease-3
MTVIDANRMHEIETRYPEYFHRSFRQRFGGLMILIATLLSARTQDATTHAASTRLFRRARTPRSMAALSVPEIEKLIYPVGFYRTKAKHVKACCKALVERHGGRVPKTMEELVALPGVGRKTANLVLILAHRSGENICVDTHVHRISNRLGWVATRTPEQTEHALERLEDGSYGICESCGNPIGKLRLQAAPRATLCMPCKKKQERR